MENEYGKRKAKMGNENGKRKTKMVDKKKIYIYKKQRNLRPNYELTYDNGEVGSQMRACAFTRGAVHGLDKCQRR